MEKSKLYTEEQVQKLINERCTALSNKLDEQRATIDRQSATIAQISSEINEYKSKDSTISMAIISAVEKAQQIESTSKKLYQMEIERIRLLYLKMENVLKQLYARYPELRKNSEVNDIMDKVGLVLSNNISPVSSQPLMKYAMSSATVEDPIKKLLNKITTIFDKNDDQKVTLKRKTIPESSSGFDLKEALNPTEQLSDIMKAFNIEPAKKNGQK
ncbi:MAG: hypothetical protein MR862_04305 [Clostridia bacterium]|nr:hypothetical protein [Clostridia bacterium]